MMAASVGVVFSNFLISFVNDAMSTSLDLESTLAGGSDKNIYLRKALIFMSNTLKNQ